MSMFSKLQAIASASPEDLQVSMKAAALCFGFSELKKQQRSAIEATLSGKNVFVSLPTGFGKLLIYQLLPVCADELALLSPVGPGFKPFVLIVSPLISLMQDQVASLRCKGFRASLCILNQCQRDGQDDSWNLEDSYIFASPEGLLGVSQWRKIILSDGFRDNILALVINEAHCVAKW